MRKSIENSPRSSLIWHAPLTSILVFAAALASAQAVAHAQVSAPFSSKPVTIEADGRVLSDILDKVEVAFKSPIDFEDAPLESAADLVVVTVPGARVEKSLGSPVSNLTVTFTELDSTPYLAAQSLIGAYAQAGYPGVYKVVPHDNRVDVVPAQVRSAGGSMRDVTPILTLPLTFPLAKRTLGDTMQLIMDAVSKQSGYAVFPSGSAPGFPLQTIELGANGESVGDVIENLATALHTVLAARFLYDPNQKTYYLDLKGVAPPDAPGQPAVPGPKKNNPTHGPANSPFFVKSN